ncbi:MAG: hypothetical protein BM556_05135 [Bacteriovorax sp. MedPE-SWde]|nr:MAG: hypothetical protein BM556_05135 [Bacteriovorax sp. MedPE-SWde]
MIARILSGLFLITIFSSCSVMKTIALRPTGKIIYDASFDQQVENDWELFEQSLGSNIKLMEALLSQDEWNKDLLVSLLKGYVAKGFAIHETYYLKDKLNDEDDSIHRKRALASYTRGLQVGVKFLMSEGLPENVLTQNLNTPDKLYEIIDSEFSNNKRDIEGILYTAQTLAALVNLQRENMKVISYLPVAKRLFDWACSKDPNIALGACDIFYASYDSGRPKMLGGDPERGRQKFLAGIKKWPENYLMREAYVEFYALPMIDQDIFARQKLFFSKKGTEFENSRYWKGQPIRINKKSYTNVFNMIAIKRMQIIEKFEEDIF